MIIITHFSAVFKCRDLLTVDFQQNRIPGSKEVFICSGEVRTQRYAKFIYFDYCYFVSVVIYYIWNILMKSKTYKVIN